jgi:histidinol-phosphate aminotransferase
MSERSRYVRLDRNEHVTPFPEAVRKDMLASLPPDIFSAYPDTSPLYTRLSRRHAVSEERIFITSGSDSAIRRLFETFVSPGDRIVLLTPTYAMYASMSTRF